jgi:cbb3-type cytochrome oxidase maturation protein
MPFGLLVVELWMAFVALFGLVLLGWGLFNGQFDDIEATKWIVLNEREPADWPGRSRAKEV